MKLVPDIAWRLSGRGSAALDPRLLPLLREIRSRATLRAATAAAGISYRSAWDLLGAQARTLGAPLVALERGRGTRLAPLGETLLAADDAARSRLATVSEQLTVRVVPQHSAAAGLRVCASHDLLLAEFAATAKPALDLAFRGSLESVASYAHGDADVAGFHLPPGVMAQAPLRGLVQPKRDRLLRFAVREQGLIVAAGNPKRIRATGDLAQRGVRFVNRQRGSGTRLLIDQLLRQSGVTPADLQGYDQEEFTHVAVAATIATGRADAGVGVRAAATRFGLEFIPLHRERYWLLVHQRALKEQRLEQFRAALAGPALARLARRLGGYDVTGAGEVLALSALDVESL
jgi:putative molybdopterin biosynthesis protein